MNKIRMLVWVAFAALVIAGPAVCQDRSANGFDRMKSLVGEWQGKKSDGQQVELTYELMSNGSAIVETMSPADEPGMVTVYHRDGDKLMMTHYCSAGNQPRMVAVDAGSETIAFDLLDVTNLGNPEDGHMQSMKITFRDRNHIIQTWNFGMGEKRMPATFEFKRKG